MTRAGHHSSDLGRRVALRREELGLSRAQVADRAGMHVGYLVYLEEDRAAEVATGNLLRLAAALETTSAALLGGDIERPPGRGRAAPIAHLEEIDEDECWQLLTAGGVGRFVFLAARGPIAVPVNYQVVAGAVVFRTNAASSLANVGDGEAVSLEVDHIDEAMSEGWSVLASGMLEHADRALQEQLAGSGIEPWAGEDTRDTYLRFIPVEVTGRRIRAGS